MAGEKRTLGRSLERGPPGVCYGWIADVGSPNILLLSNGKRAVDFTYSVALALSVFIGFASALVFIVVRGRSYFRLAAFALIAAIAADFALLIDWSLADEMTVSFLLRDAAIFATCGLIGCAVGALPLIVSRLIYRGFRSSRQERT